VFDIIFLATLVALAVVPKKNRKWKIVFWIIFVLNFGIRVYYIHKSHALSKKVQQVQELSKAPSLTLSGNSLSKLENGYKLTLQFAPSKNVHLGILVFTAKIAGDSDVRIVRFSPSPEGPICQTGNDSEKLSPDGKTARLSYALMSVGRPKLDLTITGRATVEISGNRLEQSYVMSVVQNAEQAHER